MPEETPPLTPTEELIVEVLVARHRLGEPFWPIERRNAKAINSLEARGLVTQMSGWGPTDVRVSPTQLLLDHHLKADYVPPALDPNCRAFYFGELTGGYRVECDKPAGHTARKNPRKQRHRHRYNHASLADVYWTDADFETAVAAYAQRMGRDSYDTNTAAAADAATADTDAEEVPSPNAAEDEPGKTPKSRKKSRKRGDAKGRK